MAGWPKWGFLGAICYVAALSPKTTGNLSTEMQKQLSKKKKNTVESEGF
jgi:hypothetical protein